MKKNNLKKNTLAIACGGTGGHFFPGLSIAEEYQRQGRTSMLVIAGDFNQGYYNFAQNLNIKTLRSNTARFPSQKIRIPLFVIKFSFAVIMNIITIFRNNIKVVLIMGSFTSAPLGVAAVLTGKPLLIHEGNAVLGRTNRILSRWSKMVLLSMPLKNSIPRCMDQRIVGLPVRKSFIGAGKEKLNFVERTHFCNENNLSPHVPILLIFGGSQGAQKINQMILEAVQLMTGDAQKFQFIHLTGQNDNSVFVNLYRQKGIRSLVKKFDYGIERLASIADFVISRAGASTIFELACLGKPVLLIPLSTALDNHQRENAEFVLKNNAGFAVEEANCTGRLLLGYIEMMINNPKRLVKLGENLRKLAKPNSAREIVNTILEIRT